MRNWRRARAYSRCRAHDLFLLHFFFYFVFAHALNETHLSNARCPFFLDLVVFASFRLKRGKKNQFAKLKNKEKRRCSTTRGDDDDSVRFIQAKVFFFCLCWRAFSFFLLRMWFDWLLLWLLVSVAARGFFAWIWKLFTFSISVCTH